MLSSSAETAYFTLDSTKTDWSTVSSLAQCTSMSPCNISPNSRDIATDLTMRFLQGSYLAPASGAIVFGLSLIAPNLQITIKSSEELYTSANSIDFLSFNITDSTGGAPTSNVTISSIFMLGPSTLRLKGLNHVEFVQSGMSEGVSALLEDVVALSLTNTSWALPLSSTPISYKSSNHGSFNSISLSKCSFSCAHINGGCRHPFALTTGSTNTAISFTVESVRLRLISGFSYFPKDTSIHPLSLRYNLVRNNTFQIVASSALDYAAEFSIFASQLVPGNAFFESLLAVKSSIILRGSIGAQNLLSHPMRIYLSESIIGTLTIPTNAPISIDGGSYLIDSTLTIMNQTDVQIIDTTFLTTSAGSLSVACVFLHNTTAFVRNALFLDETSTQSNIRPNLFLSNSTLLASSPYFSGSSSLLVSRLSVAPDSRLAGTIEVGTSLTGNLTAFVPGTYNPTIGLLSGDVVLSFQRTSTVKDILVFNESVTFVNVALRDLKYMRYQITSASSTAAISYNSDVPLLGSPAPKIGFSWNSSVYTPSTTQVSSFLSSRAFESSVSVRALSNSAAPMAWDPEISTPGYTFSTAWDDSINSSISFIVTGESSPLASGCAGLPPTSEFQCVNGKWTSTTSISTNSTSQPIVIASPTIVFGNFSAPSLTFDGLGSTLEVSGCASFPQNVTVSLTLGDLKKLQKTKSLPTILVESSCNATAQQELSINVVAGDKKSCEKVSGKLSYRGSQMVGLFKLDNSKCSSNIWWIILVSVLGGVVLLLITLIIIFTTVPAARLCIRPYLNRGRSKNEAEF